MGRNLTLALLFAAIGCASAGSSVAPAVALKQTTLVADQYSAIQPGMGIPMQYRLDIDNPSEHEVKLVMVELETVGHSGAYAMNRVRHAFDRVIPARSKASIEIRAWVQRLQMDLKGDTDNPVMLRGTARFEGPDGSMRRNFVARGQ